MAKASEEGSTNGHLSNFERWRKDDWVPHLRASKVAMDQISDIHNYARHFERLEDLPKIVTAIESVKDSVDTVRVGLDSMHSALIAPATDKRFFWFTLLIFGAIIAALLFKDASNSFSISTDGIKIGHNDGAKDIGH